MAEPPAEKDEPRTTDDVFVPRRRPFRKLFAWAILVAFGLILLAMIAILIFG